MFCAAPFLNMYYKYGGKGNHEMRPCCEVRNNEVWRSFKTVEEFRNSDILKEMQQAMLRNEPHEHCKYCVHKENIGGYKARNGYNKYAKDFVKGDITKLKSPIVLDYRGSNFCNYKCRMCDHANSSLIAEEMYENPEEYKGLSNLNLTDFPVEQFLYNKDDKFSKFIDTINLDNLEIIKLLGGEPMIQKEVFYILDKIKNPWDVALQFTTNGSNAAFVKRLDKFKKLSIRVSLDGIGKMHEYVRTGGIWDRTYKNMEIFANTPKTILSISFVVQMYNIFNMIDALEYSYNLHKRYRNIGETIYHIVGQSWLQPAMLYEEDYNYVIDSLYDYMLKRPDNPDTQLLLNILENNPLVPDPNHRERFAKYTNMQDKLRGTSLIDINPRFEKYL